MMLFQYSNSDSNFSVIYTFFWVGLIVQRSSVRKNFYQLIITAIKFTENYVSHIQI